MSDISRGPAIARAHGMRALTLLFAVLCCQVGCDNGSHARASDMSVPLDGGAATCTLGSRSCDPMLGCVDDYGCNWCACPPTANRNRVAECNEVGCDGGSVGAPCRTPADCGTGGLCLFDPGCSLTGRCTQMEVCGNLLVGVSLTFCGCDGATATTLVTCAMQQPYRHLGACP
jgi:hypothetical protein